MVLGVLPRAECLSAALPSTHLSMRARPRRRRVRGRAWHWLSAGAAAAAALFGAVPLPECALRAELFVLLCV